MLEEMELNVGECDGFHRSRIRRLHSIMGYLSDGINHSATAMHNAVKQNFTSKIYSLTGELMTAVVWWRRLIIKCHSLSSERNENAEI